LSTVRHRGQIAGANELEVVERRRPSQMLLVNRLRQSVDACRGAD
jgi:hypothetical protein